MRNVAVKFVEKIKTHLFCLIASFFKNRAVYKITWKLFSERGRKHENVAHAQCMLDT